MNKGGWCMLSRSIHAAMRLVPIVASSAEALATNGSSSLWPGCEVPVSSIADEQTHRRSASHTTSMLLARHL